MKKLVERLLIFFIGVPVIFCVVLLFPQKNHLALNLIVMIFSSLGAVELSVLIAQKNLKISKIEAALLGALPPAAMILIIAFDFHELLLPAVIAGSACWLLLSGIFAPGKAMENFVNRFAAGCTVLLYPGILLTWLVELSRWGKSSSYIILIFIAAIFAGDGTAWAAGMLFGKGNQGIIPASPNKSIAGFIGGIFGSMVVGVGGVLIWPKVFVPDGISVFGIPVVAGAVLGLVTGLAGILGDLGESAIKRSSGLKDSGHIIPGRGGVLDSIDSVILASPVFYIAFRVLFAQP
jgi:phosphatidate cytidylyltransferase